MNENKQVNDMDEINDLGRVPELRLKNDRWERFCNEYVCNGGRGAAAARAAGYAPDYADRHAYKLLRNAEILARIAALKKPLFDRYAVTADRTIREIAKLAYSSMADYTRRDENDNVAPGEAGRIVIDLSDCTPEAWDAIKEYSVVAMADFESDDGSTKQVLKTTVKLHDKSSALELLAKYQGLTPDKAVHDGEVKHPVPAEERARRVAFMLRQAREQGKQKANEKHNGIPAPARGENSETTNGPLEDHSNEWLDTGAPGAAGGVNQDLEAVGAQHRAAD